MPKVTDAHRAARRHEIASAALRCFARKGFQATSVADIIAESGLSAGAIYGHYKSKEELIALAIGEVLDLRFADVEAARNASPMLSPGELVGLLVRGITTEIGDLGLLVQIWAQAAVDSEMRPLLQRIGDKVTAIFHDYLRDWYGREAGLDSEDAEQSAALNAGLYVGILQGYVLQTTIFSDFDGERYLAAASAIRPVSHAAEARTA